MKNYLLVIVTLCLVGCDSRFKDIDTKKQHWEISDYEAVQREIILNTPEGERFPGLDNHQEIFEKIISKDNVSHFIDNEKLGLKFRNEFSDKLFFVYKYLDEAYSAVNPLDKYIYPDELVRLKEWGLFIQLKYFKLGNEEILKNAVNLDDKYTKDVIKNNELAAIRNFSTGISFLTTEDALTQQAVDYYSKTIDVYYPKLLENYPAADYSLLQQTVKTMLARVKSESLKKSLQALDERITKHKNAATSQQNMNNGK